MNTNPVLVTLSQMMYFRLELPYSRAIQRWYAIMIIIYILSKMIATVFFTLITYT